MLERKKVRFVSKKERKTRKVLINLKNRNLE